MQICYPIPMVFSSSTDRLQSYLKTRAPFSVIDRGKTLLSSGAVLETTRYAERISGVVRENEEVVHTVSIRVISASELEASCSCSSDDDMRDQWCSHAIALLLKAVDLDFFANAAGFAPQESIQRSTALSPQSISSLIRDLGDSNPTVNAQENYLPDVEIALDCSSDRFGIQVCWDLIPQQPVLFEQFRKRSARQLDTMLLETLDEHGVWDESGMLWYVNASNEIEKVLGFIQEYPKLVEYRTKKPITLGANLQVGAKLILTWREKDLELSMKWVLPDGTLIARSEEVVGTGPLWSLIKGVLYKLSPEAARISSTVSSPTAITLPRGQSGPIIESLETLSPLIEIKNKDKQPKAEVHAPEVTLNLSIIADKQEHFNSSSTVELSGVLDFHYDKVADNAPTVYVPDRDAERLAMNELVESGFIRDLSGRRFIVRGDSALDIIVKGRNAFPDTWKCEGFEDIQKQIRFSDLSLEVQLEAGKDSDKKNNPIDWFECKVSLSQNKARIPLSTLFRQHRNDQDRWIQMDGGAYARVPGGSLKSLKSHLTIIDTRFSLSNSIRSKLSRAQALSISSWSDQGIELALPESLSTLQKRLSEIREIPDVKISKKFSGALRPYQHDGLRWLSFLHEFQIGGILADEMGLGKTVQTLAFLQHLKDKGDLKHPALVVAPTSVVTNWLYEGARFTPGLKFLLMHGPQRKNYFGTLKNYDVIITSYALLRFDKIQLSSQQFSYVILDEAQNIKNPTTTTAQAAKSLKSINRFVLTGTPTENRPLELWSIFDFLMPGYLGSIDFFKHQIERPIIENIGDTDVTKFVVGKTRPFILRRIKSNVEKDLPPKTESILYVQMTQSQRSLYSQILEEVRPRVFDAVSKKGVRGASVSILAALLRLRQVCNHPNSIGGLTNLAGFDSGKFILLQELITESLEAGRKILLFSQFLEMLSIIRRWLDKKHVNYLYLDGATKERQPLIDQFNSSSEVKLFLMSLKAGGTGLNLATADTVIIYDPWWNPAVESQAIDRAHRIGQTKPVNVYRLVTEDSVEQKIMLLKDKKSKMVDALLGQGEMGTLRLSKLDIEALFAPPTL
jgi:superfamily II DNA or RNA helicase